jgi:hypothetical protein
MHGMVGFIASVLDIQRIKKILPLLILTDTSPVLLEQLSLEIAHVFAPRVLDSDEPFPSGRGLSAPA